MRVTTTTIPHCRRHIIVLALANDDGTSAFVAPSSGQIRPAVVSPSLHASASDPYSSMLDAISTAADAASSAAATSSELASSLHIIPSSSSYGDAAPFIMTPEAISTAQAKLSVLESNLAASSDPAAMSRAITDALDASIRAAEHAASSTSVLASNLENFDRALAESYALAPQFHLLPPETADVAQAKMAALIHNLSGAAVDDAFLTNFLADVDRRLDSLAPGVSASAVLMYGTLAFVLAYSQRRAGVRGYKEELREMLIEGEFDIDALAKDVGLAEAVAIVQEEAATTTTQQLEDPAIAMASIVAKEDSKSATMAKSGNKGEKAAWEFEALLTTAAVVALRKKKAESAPAVNTVHRQIEDLMAAVAEEDVVEPVTAVPRNEREEAAREVEALLTAPAKVAPVEEPSHVVAPMKATVAAEKVKQVNLAAPKPPIEDVPMKTLMEAAASEDIEPESLVVVEFAKKEKEVKVVQQKKKAAPTRRVASPLARLLAEELGLDLNKFGKGSGKNGRILIDDVRQYQAAKASMENVGGAYFATARA